MLSKSGADSKPQDVLVPAQHMYYTLIKKENYTFLIYKEIQMGSVAKSYMRKGFLILYMRKSTNI